MPSSLYTRPFVTDEWMIFSLCVLYREGSKETNDTNFYLVWLYIVPLIWCIHYSLISTEPYVFDLAVM